MKESDSDRLLLRKRQREVFVGVKVAWVHPIGAHHLAIAFSDGSRGETDLEPHLTGPVFEPLRDERAFAEVFLDDGIVSWPGGADLAPEFLRSILIPSPDLAEVPVSGLFISADASPVKVRGMQVSVREPWLLSFAVRREDVGPIYILLAGNFVLVDVIARSACLERKVLLVPGAPLAVFPDDAILLGRELSPRECLEFFVRERERPDVAACVAAVDVSAGGVVALLAPHPGGASD